MMSDALRVLRMNTELSQGSPGARLGLMPGYASMSSSAKTSRNRQDSMLSRDPPPNRACAAEFNAVREHIIESRQLPPGSGRIRRHAAIHRQSVPAPARHRPCLSFRAQAAKPPKPRSLSTTRHRANPTTPRLCAAPATPGAMPQPYSRQRLGIVCHPRSYPR